MKFPNFLPLDISPIFYNLQNYSVSNTELTWTPCTEEITIRISLFSRIHFLNFSGYNGASQYQPHQGLGIRTTAGAQAAQQNYFQVRPMRMAPQSAQQRGGQIQFQQPPPTPGQSQQPQPQVSQVQQQNSQQHLGTARGFVAPQNMHQPTTMMFVVRLDFFEKDFRTESREVF